MIKNTCVFTGKVMEVKDDKSKFLLAVDREHKDSNGFIVTNTQLFNCVYTKKRYRHNVSAGDKVEVLGSLHFTKTNGIEIIVKHISKK